MEIESQIKFGPWPSDSKLSSELQKVIDEIKSSLEEIDVDDVGELRYNKRVKDKSYSRQYRELLIQNLSHFGWSPKKWPIFPKEDFKPIPVTEFDSARNSPNGLYAVEMAFDHNGSVSGNLLKGSISALADIPGTKPSNKVALYVLVVGTRTFREQSMLHSSVAASEDYKKAITLFTRAYKVPCVLITISGLNGIEKLKQYVVSAN